LGVLNVLQDISDGLPHWSWLDSERREKARTAVARGTDCILKCQIRVGDRLTGWCQQHDPATYAAASARTFELASICPQETTEVVRFFMRQETSDPRIVAANDAAIAWLNEVRLKGVRVKRIPAPVEEFLRHKADFDTIVVADAETPPLWARHYEIGTDKPIFAGRDGVKRYALSEIERERRTGTPWYGGWPQKLLDKDYPKWRSKVAPPATPRRANSPP
ncbi:MAG TPA: pectate lyase, partial [Planctomycetaceae bacterium]|nr:pectate lyase [Planctomycetaceae bacterium]